MSSNNPIKLLFVITLIALELSRGILGSHSSPFDLSSTPNFNPSISLPHWFLLLFLTLLSTLPLLPCTLPSTLTSDTLYLTTSLLALHYPLSSTLFITHASSDDQSLSYLVTTLLSFSLALKMRGAHKVLLVVVYSIVNSVALVASKLPMGESLGEVVPRLVVL